VQSLLIRFVRDRSAATAIEYTLIACGIALAIVGAIGTLGAALSAKYQSISDSVQ
jgi:pilus assembly protein Flp/PilA